MARTPLFDSLQRALRLAALSERRPGLPPLDELLDMHDEMPRRRFLQNSAVAAAAAGSLVYAGCSKPTTAPATPAAGPRIAIVGGGMAGLNAAYKLQKAGLKATIFEGSDRTGGRMFTARDLMGDGLTTELGGEFIDSTHEEMLTLMTEFNLERLDTQGPEAASLKKETYFIKGRHYSIADAARAFAPAAKRIMKDYDSLEDVVDFEHEGGGKELDQISMAAYFDNIGVKGWMRDLLDIAYVTEYGLDAGEQSSLNFLMLIGTGPLDDDSAFEALGESDERYKVKGGNQRIVDELAKRVETQIRKQHRLEALKSKGEGFTLTFQENGKAVDEDADIVILAIPFTLLREVRIDVDLPPVKKKSIQELGYGANAKVLVGFKSRPWQKLGYSGSTYSTETFQLAWDNSFLQAAPAGGLTLYSGGKLGIEAGNGSAEEAAARLLTGIERAYPGTLKERSGKTSRFHWPTHPWTKGSYACYKPGQWTTIGGAEGLPAGNLFFAGEHCSVDFQGYMNGAAQSGKEVAEALIEKLSGKKTARLLSRRHWLRANG